MKRRSFIAVLVGLLPGCRFLDARRDMKHNCRRDLYNVPHTCEGFDGWTFCYSTESRMWRAWKGAYGSAYPYTLFTSTKCRDVHLAVQAWENAR